MQSGLLLEQVNGLWFAFAPKLRAAGIKHAFTTRLGGKSLLGEGDLNMALHVADDAKLVRENRQRASEALGIDFCRLIAAEQVHGTNIVCVDAAQAGRGRLDYTDSIAGTDGLLTNSAGLGLMLCYADCVPVIIADPISKVVAVVHAGWRGTVSLIVEQAVNKMVAEFSVRAADCLAVVGPAIGACCYKVDQKVLKMAAENMTNHQAFFYQTAENSWQFDLWQANRQQLLAVGLQADSIVMGNICTACNSRLFFSHRAEAGHTGRFAALVWL